MLVISPPNDPIAPPMAWFLADPEGVTQLMRMASSGNWAIVCWQMKRKEKR